MEAQAVLRQARATPPADWSVFRLNVPFVRQTMVRWLGIGVVSLLILVGAAIVFIPTLNVANGIALAILAFLAIGGLGLGLNAARMVRAADRFALVITPTSIVRQSGKATLILPITEIAGLFTQHADGALYRTRSNAAGEITDTFGRREMVHSIYTPLPKRLPKNKTLHGPDMVAVVDARTDLVVKLVEDERFGDLEMIAEAIRRRLRVNATAAQ